VLNAEPRAYSTCARAVLAARVDLSEREVSRATLLAEIGAYHVLIVRLAHRVDRAVLDAGSRLRAVVTATTGLDHIDVEYAHARGIAVLSLRGEHEFLRGITATAEHTWALLLALVRRIVPASASVRRGTWDRDAFRGLPRHTALR
jgi:D-3-phosphoglycerate dehydrogenase